MTKAQRDRKLDNLQKQYRALLKEKEQLERKLDNNHVKLNKMLDEIVILGRMKF